jgi:hypothetical protein
MAGEYMLTGDSKCSTNINMRPKEVLYWPSFVTEEEEEEED